MSIAKVGRFLERVATWMGLETELGKKARHEKLLRTNPEIRHLVPKPRCPHCSCRLDGLAESDSDIESTEAKSNMKQKRPKDLEKAEVITVDHAPVSGLPSAVIAEPAAVTTESSITVDEDPTVSGHDEDNKNLGEFQEIPGLGKVAFNATSLMDHEIIDFNLDNDNLKQFAACEGGPEEGDIQQQNALDKQ